MRRARQSLGTQGWFLLAAIAAGCGGEGTATAAFDARVDGAQHAHETAQSGDAGLDDGERPGESDASAMGADSADDVGSADDGDTSVEVRDAPAAGDAGDEVDSSGDAGPEDADVDSPDVADEGSGSDAVDDAAGAADAADDAATEDAEDVVADGASDAPEADASADADQDAAAEAHDGDAGEDEGASTDAGDGASGDHGGDSDAETADVVDGGDDAHDTEDAVDAVDAVDGGGDPGADDAADGGATEAPRRVLLVIADDLGVDALGVYGAADDGRRYPTTPTIDGICGGVRFTRAWSYPICTSTRGTILTGRYGFRNGLTGAGTDIEIPVDEVTLPRLLTDRLDPALAHANVGKWHLGNSRELGRDDAPRTMGWGHFAGILRGGLPAYDDWTKVVDGEEVAVGRYATTESVDDAIAWLGQRGADESWLLWLAFNAPHTPYHVPPAHLHQQGDLSERQEDIDADPLPYYLAAVEALDAELGRLLAWMEAEGQGGATVIFVGDNGTPGGATQLPTRPRRAKDTLYEGGIHVPLCIRGPAVQGPSRTDDRLAQTVDLFATMLELMGLEPPAIGDGVVRDSVSLAAALRDPAAPPARAWSYAEHSTGMQISGHTLRLGDWKLIVEDDGTEQLYDLAADPDERRELFAAGTLSDPAADALARIRAILQTLRP